MSWWIWLLIGLGSGLLLALILWLIFRKKVISQIDRVAMIESNSIRLLEEKNAEIESRNKIQVIATQLETELRESAERQKQKLEELDAKTAKKFRNLTDNPDVLLHRVDKIVGSK
jgi:uncharacterized membrane protein YheB (UPF0754 family)